MHGKHRFGYLERFQGFDHPWLLVLRVLGLLVRLESTQFWYIYIVVQSYSLAQSGTNTNFDLTWPSATA